MDYITVLSGRQEPLDIYRDIAQCVGDLEEFPLLLEKICRDAVALDDDPLDQLRFALLRLQIYADIHRYQDMEQAQKTKYVAQVLEKVIFGSLMLEPEDLTVD